MKSLPFWPVAWTLAIGFLIVVLFVPLYKYFAGRQAAKTAPTMTPTD